MTSVYNFKKVCKCEHCSFSTYNVIELASHVTSHATQTLPPALTRDIYQTVYFIKEAGLSKQTSGRIYLRPQAQNILDKLSTAEILIIDGAPGTGKSTVTWLWALHQSFSICWVTSGSCGLKMLTILSCGVVLLSYEYMDITTLHFEDVEVDCLVLDGITNANRSSIERAIWWKNQNATRKLIFTSVQADIRPEIRTELNITHIFVEGWTSAEYDVAMEDPEFASEHEDINSVEEREIKFLWAGGSARWMFGTWKSLQEAVDYYISAACDTAQIVKGLKGDRSQSVVNHLITVIRGTQCLVSREITIRLVEKHEAAFLAILRVNRLLENPTVDKWVFGAELLMKVCVCVYQKKKKLLKLKIQMHNARGKTIHVKNEDGGELWHVADKHQFYDVSEISAIGALNDYDYFVPKRWNRGCYDLVRLLPYGCVQFIQIKVKLAGEHSLKTKYMVQLLDALDKHETYKIKKVAVIFLVPTYSKFKLPKCNYGKYDVLFNKDCKIHRINRLKN